jgi:phage terminase large subunit-like protein
MATSFATRANRYARDVVAGKVPAGKYVRAACNRHLADLDAAKRKDCPYRFDTKATNKICAFAENMVHIKGKWAKQKPEGLPFIRLEDWQCFLLGVPFGWLRKSDGFRRFREIYAEIPRKNSKSTIGAIIGLFMLCADNEEGAEVYAGASSMEQAYQVFRPAWLMVKKNPAFREHFGLELSGTERNPGNIFRLATASRFEPVIGKPGDGASPHCAIVDEYHEHTSSDLYDTMKTGMGARAQPMRAVITTAGTNTSGPCYDKHQEAVKVLDRTLDNPELFTVIYTIDLGSDREPGDDWADFACWRKANPNFGVSIFEDYLRAQLRDAMQSPSQQNIILTKNLNVWQSVGAAWMNMLIWERQADPALRLEQFEGMPCWLAIDLASKIDLAAVAIMFRPEWGTAFFAKHYLPEDTVERPENGHYRKWRDAGWLTVTDGARTDFRVIEEDIRAISQRFAVQELAFDQRESNYLISNIQTWASFNCVEVPQAPAHFNEPMKEFEAQVYAGTLKHCGDPCLTWQMGNVIKKQAQGGGAVKYYYPTKDKEPNKIDAIVAGIMALGRAMLSIESGYVEGSLVIV